MSTHFHAIVWLDHTQAKVFHLGLSGDDEVKLHPHLPTRHLHHKANAIGSGHAKPDTHFFDEIANALGDAGEILIIGPASAKSELAKHLREKHPAVGKRIVAVETADHPSDRQVVAYARQHFNMTPPRIATGTTG